MKKINLLIYLTIFFCLFSCSFESKPKIEGEINEVVKILVSEVLLTDNNFSNQTHLRNDLGADDLDIVEITIALENQYDIIIQDEDMAQFITIDDIISYIENNSPNIIKEKKTIVNEDAEVASIKAVLFPQQENWNNGNIRGFMDGYWKSEQLMFKSANHKTSYGWEAVYQRYKESYPDKESMGILQFTIKDVSLINSITANLHGDWQLERKNDHPEGSFWLNLSKKENKWVITTDSTITF